MTSDNIDKVLLSLEILKKNSSKKYWNITWIQGKILSNLVEIVKPKHILEVGTSNGFSTLWLARGIQSTNAKIYTVEIDKNRADEANQAFIAANVEKKIVQINSEILEWLSNRKNNEFHFDLIFLDAGQRSYLEIIKQLSKKELISNETVIICDNVCSHEHLKEFVDMMKQDFWVEIINIDSGFLVAKKN